MSRPATLLDKLIVAMDAAEDATSADQHVTLALRQGCLIVTAFDIKSGWSVGEEPRSVERRMSLDMVDDSVLEYVCRDLVEQAIMAL